jgi:lauroyl/myristoyl acyltransferase
MRPAYATARAAALLRHRLQRPKPHVDSELLVALQAGSSQVEAWTRRAALLDASDALERRVCRRIEPGEISRVMRIEGLDNLEAALEGGKGAVLYSVHLWGKYTFFGALAQAGHPPTVVARTPGPVRLEWMRALQERFGYRYIWMSDRNFGVAVEAANVLRRNGVVLMMLDWPQRGMAEVKFLGRPARLMLGAATVAQLTGSPLLDYFIYREESRWVPQVAAIGAPHTAAITTEDTLQECADRLSNHVRRDPAQWTFFCGHVHSAFVGASEPTASR